MGEISGSHARDKRETKEQTTQKNCKLFPLPSPIWSMRQALAWSRVSRAHLTNTTTITTAKNTTQLLLLLSRELERQKSFTLMLIDLSRRVIVLIPQSRFNTHHHHQNIITKQKRLSTKWTTIIKERKTNKQIKLLCVT